MADETTAGRAYDHQSQQWVNKMFGETDSQAVRRARIAPRPMGAADQVVANVAAAPVAPLAKRRIGASEYLLLIGGILLVVVGLISLSVARSETEGDAAAWAGVASVEIFFGSAMLIVITGVYAAISAWKRNRE